MFRNYITIAFRNLRKYPGYSFINIGGLAVGIAVAMLIGLWINDELSYENYHPSRDKVAQLYQQQTFNGYRHTGPAVPVPLADELQKSYSSDFKYIVLSSWTNDHILSFGEAKFSKTGNYMDVDAPALVSLTMVKGSYNGLKEQNSIMLSESVAKALFGDLDAMNQTMRIDNSLDVKVTGVYKDIPFNSDFNEIQFIAPWSLYEASEPWVKRAREGQWGNNSFQTFVQVADHADVRTVAEKIKNVKYDKGDESEREFMPAIVLHPMTDWHLRSSWTNGVQTGGQIVYVWLFGIVGIFVLLLACINFMNLSTARSEQRAKEVGIRKSIGSVRKQLINQFLCESVVVSILAFLMSIIIVSVALPWFNMLSEKQMVFPFDNGSFWGISGAFVITTGLLAGSYPALYLSSFQPVKVLKGTFRAGRFASMPRKVLVVLQFFVSVSLMIGTIVVYQQVQYTKERPVGYDRNGIVMIQMKSPDYYGKYELLQNELKRAGAIEEMAESSSPLTGVWSNNGGFDWEGRNPSIQPEFATIWVTHDFGKTVSWEVKEGRDFSRKFASDSSGVVINEAAVTFMGLKDPVGKTLKWHSENYTIVGVVKDLLMDSPFKAVKQTVYFISYERVNFIELKLDPNNSTAESLAKAEGVFKKFLPDVPFDYQFADLEHAKKFGEAERVGSLAGVFAGLAVFISCLGLFGLSSFVAEQRTKEIGIRKVLGASVTNLWKMLSKDFVVLVIIACVISIPFAYYVLNSWLTTFEYRTEVSWSVFELATAGALFITLCTVSFQAIKAAIANPVNSLRSE
jgi:ABC-type antimicrobial peptide transport system permease subunit